MSRVGNNVPDVMFYFGSKAAVDYKSSEEMFKGQRVVLFAAPAAFVNSNHLIEVESSYDEFKELGIDEVFYISVNDHEVMNVWSEQCKIKKVKLIPDGNCTFASEMNIDTQRYSTGFGIRSWRYAAIIDDNKIEKWFEEPGKKENVETDSYDATSAEKVLQWLRAKAVEKERG